MKYILISLLFCICYMGEAQFPHKVIAGDDLEIHYGPIVHDIKLTPDDLCRLMMMGYKISNSDTFTPKPLNIKMKPRWRDSLTNINDGVIRDMTDNETHWIPLTSTGTTTAPTNDTTRCIMLVSDTSSHNGYRTQRCYWMYGYAVGEVITTQSISNFDRYGIIKSPEVVYLDDKKVPLSKNLIVWISKEIK